MIKVATVCSGIGSPEVAIDELQIPHEIVFACDIDKYARESYLANFTPGTMYTDMTKESWIGGGYYADLFIGGIPCQAFSLAGKRLGELDKRGLLFYDYYRYVKEQQPKAFIIENVKGLLSDNNGKTFQNWLLLLGDSVNGHHQMFGHPDSLGYNLHHIVLNSKDFGVPQNRERVFIVGIRPDLPNNFRFPAGQRLSLKLKDILEPIVDEKYYLSDKMLSCLVNHSDNMQAAGNGFKMNFKNGEDIANTVKANYYKMPGDADYIQESEPILKEVFHDPNQHKTNGVVYDSDGISRTIKAAAGGGGAKTGYYLVPEEKVLVSKERRTEEAKAERRETGTNSFRGKEITFEPSDVMNCLQTGLTNDHLIVVPDRVIQLNESKESGGQQPYKQNRVYDGVNGITPTLDTECGRPAYLIELPAVLSPKRTEYGKEIRKDYEAGKVEAKRNEVARLEPRTDGISNTVTTVQKDNLILVGNVSDGYERNGRVYDEEGISPTITAKQGGGHEPAIKTGYRIRRLTPLECWRLQGFPDQYFFRAQYQGNEYPQFILNQYPDLSRSLHAGKKLMSDSQLYKQAGNSMTRHVMQAIIKNLLPILNYNG
jgi:DNA-cytosine methyltransferase